MDRSYFENALEVLTCINIGSSRSEDVCVLVDIGDHYYQEVLESLSDWELIEYQKNNITLTARGKNVLSYYHNPTIMKSSECNIIIG